ncbi:AAA family ATPase [Chondromyces apiculatus]|uniref:AAA family ATPase n=1 Tax=Chondromyces apiculatus TaxID=51 RepID=UPI0009E057DC|nr:AAA family ATPase [Chondromyces apiculatus]
MTDHIERFTAKNYGCLKDVTVQLTPLHAFIGPNDSGKSTLLRAIEHVLANAKLNTEVPAGVSLPLANPEVSVNSWLEVCWRNVVYRLRRTNGSFGVDVDIGNRTFGTSVLRNREAPMFGFAFRNWISRSPRMLRLDPDSLCHQSQLIPKQQALATDERGAGLPGIYDRIINNNVEAFLPIKQQVQKLFPSIQSIGLENVSSSSKELQIQLTSGEWIPASHVSEGCCTISFPSQKGGSLDPVRIRDLSRRESAAAVRPSSDCGRGC